MLKKAIFMGLFGFGVTSQAGVYELTVTNGANMPISPGVVYASQSSEPESRIGSASTPGFVKLCQTGMNDDRLAELQKNSKVKTVAKTDGPIFPGESKTFTITVADKDIQGLHFETMYGKTKDVCGVISINRHALAALSQHVVAQVTGRDQVVLSGGFTEPAVGENPQSLCAAAQGGVDCLRLMATAKNGSTQVRAFSGYLPSVLAFIETQYGSEDAQSLLVPTSGAILFNIVPKH